MTIDKSTSNTILDYIDNIVVPGNVFCRPGNEYFALLCLRDGMEFLYQYTLRQDRAAMERINPDGKLRVCVAGGHPDFNSIPMTFLTCIFHWYAISAVQYVRTVGAIACRLDSSRRLPQEYAKAVIPEIVVFRDKVAAHFAWSTKNSRDNDAEQLASILPPLLFCDDTFCVGALVVSRRSGNKHSDSSAIKPWSLCRTHEMLRVRYWPDHQ